MIVYTGGTFDLFHAGHVRLLRRCRELAGASGEVVVALNDDDFVEDFKGKRPVVPYEGRAEVLRACRFVDRVIRNEGGPDSRPAIEAACPDLIVVGSDWLERDYLAQLGPSAEWLTERGIGLCFLPYTKGVSSTLIREAI